MMLTPRILCTKLLSPSETTLLRIQCQSITSRTHVKDYRPKPGRTLPTKPFIPPRKKDAYLTHPTPIIDPFETSFEPVKEFDPIQEFYDNTEDPNMSKTETETDLTDSTETEEEAQDETFRNIWPYKKWLWRSDKNFEGKSFNPKQTLEYFIDDENNNVGRAWYITELRYKSNEDLWKLWYVLLREKNMLNSMRFACRAAKRQMPNYGRLKKVHKSMGRLRYVWCERANLKLANLEQEQNKKRDKARTNAIEYRRAVLLNKREKIKNIFFKYVNELNKDGKNIKHLFPKMNMKRRRLKNKRHYIIDEPMKPKHVLTSSESTMIPNDLLVVIEEGIKQWNRQENGESIRSIVSQYDDIRL